MATENLMRTPDTCGATTQYHEHHRKRIVSPEIGGIWTMTSRLVPGLLLTTLGCILLTVPRPNLLFAQPTEEEETNPKKPVKTIVVEDDETAVDVPDGAVYFPLRAVSRAVNNETNPSLKQFFAKFTVAFDRATDTKGQSARLTPIPFVLGKDKFPPQFDGYPIDDQNRPQPFQPVFTARLRRIEPFEKVAILEVEKLLTSESKTPADPKSKAKLAAAELVLSEVLLFHDQAREKEIRRGPSWGPFKSALDEKLREVRISRVKLAAADRDWPRVRDLTARLAERYRKDPATLEPVFAARLGEAEELLQSQSVVDLERARELVNDFDSRFPNSADETAKRVRKAITSRAAKMFLDAERLANQDPTQARNILRTVETLEPDLPGLRDFQQKLKIGYSVLLVGTRQLPERMSPATARSDSEKQAVELLFESLMTTVPDDQLGVRYIPELSADRPAVGPGSREFSLVRAEWAGPEKGTLDSSDIVETFRLLRQQPESWAAEPLEWLGEPGQNPEDLARVRLRFRRGHPDSRSLLTFKILPGRYLTAKNKTSDDTEFAKKPFGTGPFRLAPPKQAGEVIFVANPGYAHRPGKLGQPAIKEVRFVDVSKLKDLPAEFRGDRLHILTDVPTRDLAKYTAQTNLGGKVRVATAAAPRRVHILAINHRRPAMQSADLRRGLMHAIDRNAILNEVFRVSPDEFHRPMAGPFPPNSWATPHAVGLPPTPLLDRDKALAGFRKYLADKSAIAVVSLSFPDDDPLAREACEKIKTQIEAVTATETRKLSIHLDPVPAKDLLQRVDEEHRFDLAYLPYDYRDDWFPLDLGSFLDPAAAGSRARNLTGYLSRDSKPNPDDHRLGELLQEVRNYRDVSGKLSPLAFDIHRQFNKTVPFVPLWHLDRHTIFSTSLKIFLDGTTGEASPRLLDPTTLFNSVGRWRLD